jgi:hypothetical protein
MVEGQSFFSCAVSMLTYNHRKMCIDFRSSRGSRVTTYPFQPHPCPPSASSQVLASRKTIAGAHGLRPRRSARSRSPSTGTSVGVAPTSGAKKRAHAQRQRRRRQRLQRLYQLRRARLECSYTLYARDSLNSVVLPY